MIDTEVEGSPESVESVAAWLRSSLAVEVAAAADAAASTRSFSAGAWEGEAGEEYRDQARRLVKVTDRHKLRVERAAVLLDRYAARLRGIRTRMTGIRIEAATGGLTVIGAVIHDPPPVSPVELLELYGELADQVATAHEDFLDWIDTELGPEPRSLKIDASDVDRVVESTQFRSAMIGFAFSGYPAGLRHRADQLKGRADDLRAKRRSGHPGRRAFGNRPQTRTKAQELIRIGGYLGKGATFISPIGVGFELWGAGQQLAAGESPGKVIVGTAAGIGGGLIAAAGFAAGAATVASMPAWGTVVVVGVGAATMALGATHLSGIAWDALPDDVTHAVDNGIVAGWDQTKDLAGGGLELVSSGWNMVTGWV